MTVTCAVCQMPLAVAATGRPPSYCAPPSPCKGTAKRWRIWAESARELRRAARRCDDPQMVAALAERASGFDRAISYQRGQSRDGWAAATRDVDDLNAAVHADDQPF